MKPGVLYFNDSSSLCVTNNDALRGRRVHGISGGSNLYALCDDGIRDAISGEQIGRINTKPQQQLGKISTPPIYASSGGKANILATIDGKLYSWGAGKYGELGLGASKVEVNQPSEIIISPDLPKPIVQVSCGNGHSFAIDSIGNLYGWGQNFDKQLGLYTKQVEELNKYKTAIVEEMMFLPRFIPISLKYPIKKVSCGGNFTIVLTIEGQILSWGAGECGQLGTGRCTFKIIPTIVELPSISSNPFLEEKVNNNVSKKVIDIACGASHVLACTESGVVYSWGLNKRGQLGLMDTSTRHTPFIISTLEEANIIKVFAEGNSSAAINSVGRLYTWGSGSYFRLMHGSDNHFHRPKMVQALEKNAVETFAFSKTRSCALVPTCIKNCFPLTGPQKSFSKLEIYGDGFWDSENIIIKFNSANGSTFAPPRSCVGRLTAPGVITCKPPKLGDTGEYIISISMDGENFMPETLRVNIYKEVTLTSMSPKVIDYRKNDNFDITIKVKSLPIGLTLPDEFDIKLVMVSQSTMEEYDVSVKGKLIDLPPAVETEEPSLAGSSMELDRSLSLDELPEDSIEKPVDREIVCSVKASEVCDLSGNNLYIMRSKLSINTQDYSEPTHETESTICHAFTTEISQPDCYPFSLDPMTNELKVSGQSFIPSCMLADNCKMQAIVTADLGEIYGVREVISSVRCESVNELFIIPPSYAQLVQGKQIIEETNDKKKKKPPAKKVDISKIVLPDDSCMLARVMFQLITTTENVDSTIAQSINILSVSPLDLKLYKPIGVVAKPATCRRTGGIDIIIKGNTSSPISFQSLFAKICFSRTDYGIYIANEAVANETEPGIFEYKVTCPCFEIQKKEEVINNEDDAAAATATATTIENEANPSNTEISIEPEEVTNQEDQPVQPPIDYIYISALLDGITPVDESLSCKLILFDNINVISATVPKGGGAPGNPIPVTVEKLVQSESCIVRLRGTEEEGDGVLCPATMQFEASTITFTVPDAATIGTLSGEVRGKEKWYFVEVSIDGGITFDKSETAILNLK